MQVNEKAVEPAGEARPTDEVFRNLASAMGYDEPMFKESSVDIIRTALKAENPRVDGLTFERLVTEGALHINTPKTPFVNFQDGKFPTPSGKIEFYSKKMAEHGFDPLPKHTPTAESKEGSPDLFAKYPLTLLTGATKNLLSTQWSNDPIIQELDPVRHIEINPKDAKARGIEDRDQVVVKNDRGSVQLMAVLTDRVKPGVVFSEKAWWPKLCPDGKNINFLTPDRIADMGNNSTYHTNLVEVQKLTA